MISTVKKDLDSCKYIIKNSPEIKMWALDLYELDNNSENICNIVENNILPPTEPIYHYKIPKFTDLDRNNYENEYENTYGTLYAPIYEAFGKMPITTKFMWIFIWIIAVFILLNLFKS